MNSDDLIGKKFSTWEVVTPVVTHYICRCTCGVEKEIPVKNLVNSIRLSCPRCTNGSGIEKGAIFGKWTVLTALSEFKIINGRTSVLAKCECGTEKWITSCAIRHGRSTRCQSCSNKCNASKRKTFGRNKTVKMEKIK